MRKTIKNNFRKTKNRKTKNRTSKKFRRTKKTRGGSYGYGGGYKPPGYPPVTQPAPSLAPPGYGGGYVPKSVTPIGSAVQTAFQAGAAIARASPVAGAAIAAYAPPSPAVVEAAFQAGAAIATASPVAGAAIAASPYGGGMVKPPMKHHEGSGGLYDLPRPPRLGRQPTVSSQLYEELLNPANVGIFNEALFNTFTSRLSPLFEVQDDRSKSHNFITTTPTGHYVTFVDRIAGDINKQMHLSIHTPSGETSHKGALHVRFDFGETKPYRRILLYEGAIDIDTHYGRIGSIEYNNDIDIITDNIVNSIIEYYKDKGIPIRKLYR